MGTRGATVERYGNLSVIRDDLLPGGTKSVAVRAICSQKRTYVYASPVQGGFQIALAAYLGSKAVIFTAKRGEIFPNTDIVRLQGGRVIEVSPGYLSVVQARARAYAEKIDAVYLPFGCDNAIGREAIRKHVRETFKNLKPRVIVCAVGSGVLVESILQVTTCKVVGVVVGRGYQNQDKRLKLVQASLPFDKPSKALCPFPSQAHYDRKAYVVAAELAKKQEGVYFWNVL